MVGSSGRGYYADLYWPRDGVIVEIDGATKYCDRAVLVAEKRREDDLRAAGYRMLRFVAGDVFQAAPLLADQVSRAVGS